MQTSIFSPMLKSFVPENSENHFSFTWKVIMKLVLGLLGATQPSRVTRAELQMFWLVL